MNLSECLQNFQPSECLSARRSVICSSNLLTCFSNLRFANKSLKFAKIDISRSPKLAEKYSVVSSLTSRTLPTLILFKDGREFMRRPLMDTRNRVVPFSFSYVSSFKPDTSTFDCIRKLTSSFTISLIHHLIFMVGEYCVSF